MPARKLRIHPEARQDVADGRDWYADHSVLAAERFLDEVDRAVELIREAPERWPGPPRHETLCDGVVSVQHHLPRLRGFHRHLRSGPRQTTPHILAQSSIPLSLGVGGAKLREALRLVGDHSAVLQAVLLAPSPGRLPEVIASAPARKAKPNPKTAS